MTTFYDFLRPHEKYKINDMEHTKEYSLKLFRYLTDSAISKLNSVPVVNARWKVALWEPNSTEPAMLRVPIVIIFFIFLWGMNVWILDKLNIPYANALSIKKGPIMFIFVTGTILIFSYSLLMTILSNMLGISVENSITIFYLIVFIISFLPGIPGNENRLAFYRLLKLCFIPSNTISFAEVLLADALTSLSKIFKDIGVTIVVIYSKVCGVEVVNMHNNGMLLVALLASLPFAIRMRQCCIQLDGVSDTMSKIPIILNLLKYFSAFPPLWLAAYASLGYTHPNLPLIAAIMATINSLYSFLWDIIMDWGLINIYRNGKFNFRNRLLLPTICYLPAVIINLIMRFSWAANRIQFLSHLHASHLILIVELGEVMRRAMWNIYRIEWEVVNHEVINHSQI